MNVLCLEAFDLAPKMGRSRSAIHSLIAVAMQVGKYLCELIYDKMTKHAFLDQIKPRFST